MISSFTKRIQYVCLFCLKMRRSTWQKCIALVLVWSLGFSSYFLLIYSGKFQDELSTELSSDEVVGECDFVHIAMIIPSPESVRNLVVVLKSILFYRHNPLHFHFLADGRSKEIASIIFETWQLPEVNVSFYSLSDSSTEGVKWIPQSSNAALYDYAKLTLGNTLPSSLRAVLYLDIDLMVVSDIGELWEYLWDLRRVHKTFGLVENQDSSYLKRREENISYPWPANGRGYNSGVMLLNLDMLRASNWTQAWQSVARNATKMLGNASEQYIFNSALQRDNRTVLSLPCVWNVQLSENSLGDYCYESAHQFKIIRWNFTAEVDESDSYTLHFKSMLQIFEDYDSMLLRTHVSDCEVLPSTTAISTTSDSITTQSGSGSQILNGSSTEMEKLANHSSLLELQPPDSNAKHEEPTKEKKKKQTCAAIRREGKLVRRIYPYYLKYSYKSVERNDVTLVSQTSMDRLYMLESVCKHWKGPKSIALYATDSDLKELMAYVSSSSVLRDVKNLALHVVSKLGKFYPVNQLRNVALNYVQTPYVYFIDMDFLPMEGLYKYAKEAVKSLRDRKKVLIVPAFETFQWYGSEFPKSKSNVLSMLSKKTLSPFKFHEWKPGHGPTDFERWKKSDKNYKVKWAEFFEPYFIVSSDVPRFDERFVGFGVNKASHMMELSYRGYELEVLPEAFMVHMPHTPSRDKMNIKSSHDYFNCMHFVLMGEFKSELKNKTRTTF